MTIFWCVVWAVSEGESVVASDVHSFAVSEGETCSGEAASAWWYSEAGVRCDTISFQPVSEFQFLFADAARWESGAVICIAAAFRSLIACCLHYCILLRGPVGSVRNTCPCLVVTVALVGVFWNAWCGGRWLKCTRV